jgi:hypothetical protein
LYVRFDFLQPPHGTNNADVETGIPKKAQHGTIENVAVLENKMSIMSLQYYMHLLLAPD